MNTPDINRGERPNILYIESDQHNPAVTGCYGDTVVQTPNLDALAARGVTLTNAYCASPICVPSRMSMLTGRYPYENRVWTNTNILDSAIPTYAHSMGASGYRPVQIGRLHFIGPDQLHGFAERYVGDHSPNYPGSPNPVDHGALEGTAGPARVSLEKSGIGQSAYEIHDKSVTSETVDYLNRLGIRNRSEERIEPFSLSVGLMLPHQPFVAKEGDYEKYVGKVALPRTREPYSEIMHPYFRWWRKRSGIETVTDEEILRCRTAYWALVTRMDEMVGEILNALRQNGFEDNTMVVYSSDHGEQLGEHDLWWKQTFYEDSVKVPAIVSWPNGLPMGKVVPNVLNQFDLNATMLDASGCDPLPRSHGRSLLQLLRGNQHTSWENIAFSEFCMYSQTAGLPYDIHASPNGTIQRMIRYEEWKLNYYHGMPSQLFNLKEDPYEERDLSNDAMYSSTKEELFSMLMEGWDPDLISQDIRRTQSDERILSSWAANTNPPDNYRWDLKPEMDYLSH